VHLAVLAALFPSHGMAQQDRGEECKHDKIV
jgi:hypothetical protein